MLADMQARTPAPSAPRSAAVLKQLPPCPVQDCTRKARSLGKGSRCRKHGGPTTALRLAPVKPVAPLCVALGCRYKAGDNGLCGKHRLSADRTQERGCCATNGCVNKASRTAGLCHRCAEARAGDVHPCTHPACTRGTVHEYCQQHDLGIDFAAVDWFDRVAAERLYWGRHGARKPTILELQFVVNRAQREGVQLAELGQQMGLSPVKWMSWWMALKRLRPQDWNTELKLSGRPYWRAA